MSLRNSLFTASFALASVASPVMADAYVGDLSEDLGGSQSVSGVYVSAAAGFMMSQEDLNHSATDYNTDSTSMTGEAAIGYRFNRNWRLEGSYAFNAFEVDGSTLIGDVSVHSKFINAYYDFDNGSNKLIPYIGAGFGSAVVVTDDSFGGVNNTDTRQIKAGVTYDTGSNADLFGEIAWQGVDDVNVHQTTEADSFDQWKAQLGLRYTF